MVFDFFQQQPHYFVPALAIVCGTVFLVVWVMFAHWYSLRRLAVEAQLKREMLERGLSPEQIERVLGASTDNPPEAPEPPDHVSDNEYYLIQKMLDEGKSTDDIERVVRAVRSGRANGLDERIALVMKERGA